MSTGLLLSATVQLFNRLEDWHLTTGCIKGYHTRASYILLFYIWRLTTGRIEGYYTCVQNHSLLLNLRVKFVYLRVAMGKNYPGI